MRLCGKVGQVKTLLRMSRGCYRRLRRELLSVAGSALIYQGNYLLFKSRGPLFRVLYHRRHPSGKKEGPPVAKPINQQKLQGRTQHHDSNSK